MTNQAPQSDGSNSSALPDPSRLSVSILGLGLMGSALARALLRAGVRLTVWNRSIEKIRQLEDLGALAATSPKDCILSGRDLVIFCLSNSDALHSLFSQEEEEEDKDLLRVESTLSSTGAITNRSVLVNYITGSPSQVRATRQLALGKLGFSSYLHGAILAMPSGIGKQEAVLYHSGDQAAYDSANVQALLKVLGRPVFLDHDPSSASLHDTVLVSTVYSLWAGFTQSMALLKTMQCYQSGSVTARQFYQKSMQPILLHCLGQLNGMAREIDEQDHVTKGDGAQLSLHLSSLRNFCRTYDEQGLKHGILDPIIQLIEARIVQGGQHDEFTGILEVLRT